MYSCSLILSFAQQILEHKFNSIVQIGDNFPMHEPANFSKTSEKQVLYVCFPFLRIFEKICAQCSVIDCIHNFHRLVQYQFEA